MENDLLGRGRFSTIVGVEAGVFFAALELAGVAGTALPERICRFGEPSTFDDAGPADCDRSAVVRIKKNIQFNTVNIKRILFIKQNEKNVLFDTYLLLLSSSFVVIPFVGYHGERRRFFSGYCVVNHSSHLLLILESLALACHVLAMAIVHHLPYLNAMQFSNNKMMNHIWK